MRAEQEERASRTAGLVAFCRGVARFLPEDAQLAIDPFGVRFGGPAVERLARLMERSPRVAGRLIEALEPNASVLWMQLRTRAIDDALVAFAERGGRQVLLLGAGFDCRAARLVDRLPGVTFFEVDHPATQRRKRQVIADAQGKSAPVQYLAWDFERNPLSDLPATLSGVGHDPSSPTLTIWEGVTMYLTPPAIDASLAALRALSSPGSVLVFTYIERRGLRSEKILSRLVKSLGEPFTFGWDPGELPTFMQARGFAIRVDESMTDLSRRMLPARYHRLLDNGTRHVAIADRSSTAE